MDRNDFQALLATARQEADDDLVEVGRLEQEEPDTFARLAEAPGVLDPDTDGIECEGP